MARSTLFRPRLRENLRNPEFAAEYAAELQGRRIARRIGTARRAAGLTQGGLARRMGTAQPSIARPVSRLRVAWEPAGVAEPSAERQALWKATRS